MTQAVFSLKGKPLNCFGLTKKVVYENEEFNLLQHALNIEDGLDALRYNNIVIATDADVDGMHIRLLLMTFFLQFFPDLVKAGHVFILQTPLFRVRNKKETIYCYSDEERRNAIAKLGNKPEITRFKGLGEISPDEFGLFIGKDIRLDPVILKDANIKGLLEYFMGKNTPTRQMHIVNNLRVEKDDESINPLVAEEAEGSGILPGCWAITRNKGFHKVYDVPMNLIPHDTDLTMPTAEEFARFVIRRTLGALGIAYVKEMAWRARYVKGNLVKKELEKMVAAGEVHMVQVDGLKSAPLYMLPGQPTDIELAGDAFILSPFDILNVFRHRLRDFFDFDYQIECFVPAPKRKYGYFSLPVLVGDTFVARMDAKADTIR
jgi:hypothetical protein